MLLFRCLCRLSMLLLDLCQALLVTIASRRTAGVFPPVAGRPCWRRERKRKEKTLRSSAISMKLLVGVAVEGCCCYVVSPGCCCCRAFLQALLLHRSLLILWGGCCCKKRREEEEKKKGGEEREEGRKNGDRVASLTDNGDSWKGQRGREWERAPALERGEE